MNEHFEEFDEEFDPEEFISELEEDVFSILIDRGYAPTRGEAHDIAEMFFDLLIEFGFFDDEEFEDE